MTIHVEDHPLNAHSYEEEAKAHHQKFQEQLEVSRKYPFKLLALINTFFYLGIVFLSALFFYLIRRIRPDTIDKKLGEAYAHVPEMAVFKKVELTEYLKHSYGVNGVDLGAGSGIVGGIIKDEKNISCLCGVDAGAHGTFAMSQGYTSYVQADISALPLEEGQYDFAICICVIEHVKELENMINEVSRVLQAGGTFYFSTPAPWYRESTALYRFLSLVKSKALAQKMMRWEDMRALHYHYLKPEQWKKLLIDAGFQHIEVKYIFSKTQWLLFDLLNYSIKLPVLYPCEHASVILNKWPVLLRLCQWSTAVLAASIAAKEAIESNATHLFIKAEKATA